MANMVQRLIVEVDSTKLLEQYLRVALTTVLNSREELAVKALDRSVEHFSLHLPTTLSDQNKHFPVILIGGWYSPEEGKKNSYFNGYGPWTTFSFDGKKSAVDGSIEQVLGLIKVFGNSWAAEFTKKFGSGYNAGFNEYDGSVGIGYELRSCGSFPEVLALSLRHMYYGK
jgi:hypothetical protein